MSDDQVVSGFEACVRRLVEERNRPDHIPLYLAICRPEGNGGSAFEVGRFDRYLGHNDYTPGMVCSMRPPDTYATALYIPRDRGFVPTERVNALIRQADVVARELHALCARVPDNVRGRLCLPDAPDWWRTLFHLAWHFERPFLNARRERFLSEDGRHGMRVDESVVQQCGYAAVRGGIDFSRFEDMENMSVQQLGFALKVFSFEEKRLDRILGRGRFRKRDDEDDD